MLFNDSTYIGIDFSSGRKSFTYAALDHSLNLIALAEGDIEAVSAFVVGQQKSAVAVNAPSSVNHGLVRERSKRKMLAPNQLRRVELRLAEAELRERGILVTRTPASVDMCPVWMRAGFELHHRLEKAGFKKFPEKEFPSQILETNSNACYSVLAGQSALAKSSLEGRVQRQLILFERGLRIKDPMDFFEEITRYKLLRGVWPVEMLYSAEQLDALVAAYTAWLAVNKEDHILLIGDVREGRIVVPEKELKEKY
jgi:predicted nuclease with RNAse H fold